MNLLSINDIELSYRDHGSGPPLVFLHAFPLNQSMWHDQIAAFSKDYRVITLDWRGFGESSLAETETTLDLFAADLAGLLDQLGVKKAVICGLSMGGYAAFSFLRWRPGRIAGLILADTRATPDSAEGRLTRIETAAQIRRHGPAFLLPDMTRRLLGKTTCATRPDIVERINSTISSGNAEGIAQALIAMAARPDSSDLLGDIAFPALVVCGEEDALTPPHEVERMSRSIPGSKFVVIPASGHLPNIEKKEIFNETVGEFLENMVKDGAWA